MSDRIKNIEIKKIIEKDYVKGLWLSSVCTYVFMFLSLHLIRESQKETSGALQIRYHLYLRYFQ